jgi:maltose-binding protein MalE
VPDDEMFGEHKQGLFARLTRSVTMRRGNELKATVRKTERLSLTVPSEKAEAVRAAVERWLSEHGVTAAVTAEDAGEGKTKLRARLDEADAPKIDFSSEDTQSALQELLADAVK